MKTICRYLAFVMIIFATGLFSKLNAQTALSAADVQKMIENKQFTFIATSIRPLQGSPKYITESYEVKVQPSSIVSYLPYLGVSQMAPVTNEDAGIKFTSNNFEYTVDNSKEDSWSIKIVLKDQKNTRQFNFVVFDNGNATLDVMSTFRDGISFGGYIK